MAANNQDGSVDFTVNNQGSIVLLYPCTDAARTWVEENIGQGGESFQPWYPTIICEPRYIEAILEGISDAGLDFE